MNKIITICILSLTVTLFILGCTVNTRSETSNSGPQKSNSRFVYLGTNTFPSDGPLSNQQYHVYRDTITDVNYMYFHTRLPGGSEVYGGPVFSPMFNTIP